MFRKWFTLRILDMRDEKSKNFGNDYQGYSYVNAVCNEFHC